MVVTRSKKEQVLDEVRKKFEGAKSVVFSGYTGMSVNDISKVRKELRSKNVAYKVSKKTLMKIAAKENGYENIPDDVLEGQVAAVFSYDDEITGAKTLAQLGKKYEALKLLGGLMEGKILSREDVAALSKMLSKPELLAKMLGSLQAPASGVVNCLAGVTRALVQVVEAYRKKLAEQK
ncbi:MAG: 50S ribosomal protein L10 [Candidatus Gracilibacteria bacterium]|jgi:large subunit ribosomal protein L10